MMKNFTVRKIDKKTCFRWVTQKHYSRRMPIFWAGYGLFDNNGNIVGVCVYGQPSPPIQRFAFENRDFRLYELSRLVIQTKAKNAASFLISKSLGMIQRPCAVVSYADMEYNHCGIVYQSTNWMYTGATKSHDHSYMVNGERLHPTTIKDRFGVTSPKKWAKENNIKTIPPKEKHRYFYVCGSKRDKKRIIKTLKYEVFSKYPKCDQTRYDDGPTIQEKL